MAAKVLVVDDSSQERMSIGSMLGDYELITACDGVEALREIEKNPDLDLVILDINMPVMDGFQVLAGLKSGKFPRRIPVIVLTNCDEPDKEIRGLQLGAVDYIRKPVNMESLRARVEIHLEMERLQHLIEDESLQCRQMLQAIFDQAPIGIGLYFGSKPFDPQANVPPLINPMYEKITGRSKEELMKLGWAQITHPEDLEKNLEFFEKMNSGEIPGYSMEKRYIRPDGSVVWADLTVSWLHFQGSSTYNYLSFVQDITARKNAEKALLESERSKSVLLSNLPGMAYRCRYDRDRTMEFVSAGCFSLTGYTDKDLLENRVLSFNSIIAPEYRDVLWEEWRRILAERSPFKYEYEIVTASGGRKWVLEMGQGVFNSLGEVVALEGIIIDITHQKQNETRLRYLSEHHPTTGLYNRTYLESLLDGDRKRGKGENRALVLLSMKNINAINLSYGYNYCVKIMQELAARLSTFVSGNRKLFHITLDRLAFYIMGFKDDAELAEFSNSLFPAVSETRILHAVGCGIGILKIDDCDRDMDTILKNVSIAAEHAGKNGVFGYRFFDEELQKQVARESEIKEELLRISQDEDDRGLSLEYQPIVELKTGRIRTFEALARMKSDMLGTVAPSEFIPLAEELELIVPIGLRILRMGCGFIRRLREEGYEDIRLSVNVSPIQMMREGFLDDFSSILEETGTEPSGFCLEITESVFADSFDVINRKLEQFREMGTTIAIDDFGTGYSSLSREREMNVNILKIDRFFIEKLLHLTPEEAITGDIISLAHKLGHMVVAEGVELECQRQYLISNHCDFMQGFLFSRPLSPEAAIELLKETNGPADRTPMPNRSGGLSEQ